MLFLHNSFTPLHVHDVALPFLVRVDVVGFDLLLGDLGVGLWGVSGGLWNRGEEMLFGVVGLLGVVGVVRLL